MRFLKIFGVERLFAFWGEIMVGDEYFYGSGLINVLYRDDLTKMGSLKNGHFAQFGTNSYLEGARWHYKVSNVFYRVKLVDKSFSRKKLFWCGNFMGTHLRLKIFDFWPNLKFRPPGNLGCGFRSGPKIFPEKHFICTFNPP